MGIVANIAPRRGPVAVQARSPMTPLDRWNRVLALADGLTPSEVSMLHAIANHDGGSDRHCDATIATLARESGYGPKSDGAAREVIDAIVSKGLIRKARRPGKPSVLQLSEKFYGDC